MKQAIGLLAIIVLFVGCATFNSNVYKAEGVVVSAVEKAIVVWTDYYVRAVKDPAKYKTSSAALAYRRTVVDSYYSKYQTVIGVLDTARERYDKGLATQDDVTAALKAVSDSAADVENIINSFTQ